MERGDISGAVVRRVVVVLEGALAMVPPATTERQPGLRGLVTKGEKARPPANEWGWSVYAVKQINDLSARHGVPVEVVTFLGQDVADEAAEWLAMYGVRVIDILAMDYELFCASLTWRQEVDRVIDTDGERLMHYGAKAYETSWGGSFT